MKSQPCCIRNCNRPGALVIKNGRRMYPLYAKHRGDNYLDIDTTKVMLHQCGEFN